MHFSYLFCFLILLFFISWGKEASPFCGRGWSAETIVKMLHRNWSIQQQGWCFKVSYWHQVYFLYLYEGFIWYAINTYNVDFLNHWNHTQLLWLIICIVKLVSAYYMKKGKLSQFLLYAFWPVTLQFLMVLLPLMSKSI